MNIFHFTVYAYSGKFIASIHMGSSFFLMAAMTH